GGTDGPYHRNDPRHSGRGSAIQLGFERLTAPRAGRSDGLHPRRSRDTRRVDVNQLPAQRARATTFRSATSDSYAARRPSESGARSTADGWIVATTRSIGRSGPAGPGV